MNYESIKSMQKLAEVYERVRNMCPTQELKEMIDKRQELFYYNLLLSTGEKNPDFKGPSLKEMLEKQNN
jgi:hypothetical protein